jgi:hypothetical protein
MNINTINSLINNSSWTDFENRIVYNFSNGKDLEINGQNHLNYLIRCANNEIKIQLGEEKTYSVEYVNDFNIKLHNGKETIRLMPD